MALNREDLRDWLADRAGRTPAELRDDTALFSTGLLDSLAILELCSYIETKAGITIRWHDVGVANIDSIDAILRFVSSRGR